jgi:putative copper resistance protein D
MVLVALPFFMLVTCAPAAVGGSRSGYAALGTKIIPGLWIALAVQAVSGIVWFWLVTAQMNDASPGAVLDAADWGTVLGQTQFGQLWLWRGAAGLLLGVLLFFRSRGGNAGFPPRLGSWLFLVLSAALLVMLAWSGHAAAGTHFRALHVFVDAMHLLLGSVWPIGLLPLFFFFRYVEKGSGLEPGAGEGEVLRRFSDLSLLAVAGLVATGIVNSWLMVGSWEALVTTPYGRLLLGKIGAVGLMIVLGGFNRLYVLPRWRSGPAVFRLLRQTVLAESCLALVVLLIVAVMGMTPPPS